MRKTIKLKCSGCGNEFTRFLSIYKGREKEGRNNHYCTFDCAMKDRKEKDKNKTITKPCGFCGKKVIRVMAEFKKSKSGHVFCNRSCSASYNNRNKKTGHRRSKLEQLLEKHIQDKYPKINVLYNDKSAIGSELDFYFPDLKLAIELNGIFHYEPIYGEGKLNQIQDNDKQKMFACRKLGIELAVVCTHDGLRMNKKRTEMYKRIVDDIIDLARHPRENLNPQPTD